MKSILGWVVVSINYTQPSPIDYTQPSIDFRHNVINFSALLICVHSIG